MLATGTKLNSKHCKRVRERVDENVLLLYSLDDFLRVGALPAGSELAVPATVLPYTRPSCCFVPAVNLTSLLRGDGGCLSGCSLRAGGLRGGLGEGLRGLGLAASDARVRPRTEL